jgi:DNA polymerase (family 10)
MKPRPVACKSLGCVVPGGHSDSPIISRRIDIRFVPYNSYGAALLYFTGSKTFNTTIRQHALGKGYSLSEFGLKNKKDDSLITFATEEELFKFLNYPYKTPQERNI